MKSALAIAEPFSLDNSRPQEIFGPDARLSRPNPGMGIYA